MLQEEGKKKDYFVNAKNITLFGDTKDSVITIKKTEVIRTKK